MSPSDKVRRFIRIAIRHVFDSPDDLIQALTQDGLPPLDAECLLAFVPIAFAHALFDGFGVGFQPGFEIRNPDSGASAHGLLQDQPIFVAAHELGAQMVKGDESACKIAMQIAGLSAELNVINQLVGKGGSMTDIVLTEPVMLRLPVEYLTGKKSWWRRLLRF